MIEHNVERVSLEELCRLLTAAVEAYPDHPSGMTAQILLENKSSRYGQAMQETVTAICQRDVELAQFWLDKAKQLNNGAVATSGNYENYFDKDKIHHHIIDKSIGDSPVQTISASVVAPTVMQADALSTSLFVLKPKESIQLASSLSNIEALIISKGGRRYRSSGWNNIV